ncbi:hypothetical protein V8B97DRAFT_1602878 [Scleroderma yunnanense]
MSSKPHNELNPITDNDTDTRGQKRQREDIQSDSSRENASHRNVDELISQQGSSSSTQISTWEMPPLTSPPISLDDDNARPDPTAPSPIAAPGSNDEIIVISHKPRRDSIGSAIEVLDEPPVPSTSNVTSSPFEPLATYTCPICLSPPTNATLTPCGHICCGPCLFTAVKATMQRSMVVAMDRAPAPRCPVCRAEIPGWDGRGGGVVGLKIQVVYSV